MKTVKYIIIVSLVFAFTVRELYIARGFKTLQDFFSGKHNNEFEKIEFKPKDQGFIWLLKNAEYEALNTHWWFKWKLLSKFLYYAVKDIQEHAKDEKLW